MGSGKIMSSKVSSVERDLPDCTAIAEEAWEPGDSGCGNYALTAARGVNAEGVGVAGSLESAKVISCTRLDWAASGERCGEETVDSSCVPNLGYSGGTIIPYVDGTDWALV